MSGSLRQVWTEAPLDPDPETDLGYKYDPLTVVHVDQDGEQYIFLPGEEDHLTDSEFIIADPDSVRSLKERR
ncbi:MAG: hypothetical protein ACOCY7_01215 [Halodesulfurarchaeum sp.]